MCFIGQVNAHFTSSVADFELYLFYSRKHRLVTQVVPISWSESRVPPALHRG